MWKHRKCRRFNVSPPPQTFEMIFNGYQLVSGGRDCHQPPETLISSPAGWLRRSTTSRSAGVCGDESSPHLLSPRRGETRRERTVRPRHGFKQSEWDSGGKCDDVKSQTNSWREGEERPETQRISLQNKSIVCSVAGREYVINMKVGRV